MSINPVPLQGDREEWHCSREGRKDRRGHLLGDFASISFPCFYIHFASFSTNSTKVLFPMGNVHPCGPAISSCLTSDFTGVLACLQGGVHNGVTLDGGVSTRPQNQCNEGTFYIFWKAHPQSRVCGSVACFHILRAHRDGRCQRIPLRKKCPSQKRS